MLCHSLLVFCLVVCIASATRPDFSNVPGYAETRARLVQLRSRETAEVGREFGNDGLKLDDFGTFLRYRADVKRELVAIDFEDNVEDIQCGTETMAITQRVDGNEHEFTAGQYISASGLWHCDGSNAPVYRRITGVLSTDMSSDGKISVVVVSTKDIPFTEMFNSVNANTFYSGYAAQFIKEVKKNTEVLEGEKMKRGEEDINLTEPTPYLNVISGNSLPLAFESGITLLNPDSVMVSLRGKKSVVFSKQFVTANSSYSSVLDIDSRTLCGNYTFRFNHCKRDQCRLLYEVPVSFNYIAKILITDPTYHNEFNSGDSVMVQWDFEPNGGAPQNVTLNTYSVDKDGTMTVKPECIWKGMMAERNHTFPSSCFTLGGRYKFELVYNDDGEAISSSTFSDLITYDEPSDTHSIDVYEPDIGDYFQSGETLTVEWEPYKWNDDDTVNIYLYQDVLGPDSLLFSQTGVRVNARTLSFTIPDKSIVGSGTNYYIYIGYDCGSFWCSEGFYSKSFAINSESPFIITNEIPDDAMYSPEDTQTVTWKTTLTTPDEIYVKIRAENPSIIKLSDATLASVKTTATALSVSIKPERGSVLPVYFQIAYDCWFWGHLCTTVNSKKFNLVEFHKTLWNEDDKGNIKEPHIVIKDLTCASECGSDSGSLLFCTACNAGVDMAASATCDNCHANLRAGFYGLQLDFTGTTLEFFQLGFYGRAQVGIDLNLKASAQFSKSFIRDLFSADVVSTGFYIGPVSISLTVTLTGELPVAFNLEGSMQGSIQAEGTMDFSAEAKYGQYVPQEKKGVNVIPRMTSTLPLSYSFYTHLKASSSVGFKISAFASAASILNLNTFAQVTATLNGEVDRFPALPTEKLYENSTWNYGSCLNPHRLEYDLQTKINAHADADFEFVSSPLFDVDYESPNPYIILSGCLLPMNATDDNDKVYWKFFKTSDLSRDSIPFADDVLDVGLASELTDLMRWPKGSLITSVLTSGKSVTGVNVTLFPVTASGAQKYSTRTQLEGRLAETLNDQKSAFYSGTVGKYFKGKFEEQNVESYSSLPALSSSSVLSVSGVVLSIAMAVMVISSL